MSCDSIVNSNDRGRMRPAPPRTLVAGLGNPILGDDGIGWRVAEEVGRKLAGYNGRASHVTVDSFALGGLSLMEQLIGYDRAIVIDAIQTSDGQVGQVYRLSLADLPDFSTGHTTAVHDTSLSTALRLGRTMGVELPQEVMVVGIEAEQVYDFSEELSPAVAAAVPKAVQAVLELLHIDQLMDPEPS